MSINPASQGMISHINDSINALQTAKNQVNADLAAARQAGFNQTASVMESVVAALDKSMDELRSALAGASDVVNNNL